MIRKNIIPAILFSILFASCAGSKNSMLSDTPQNVARQQDTLTIDGNDGDWTQALTYSESKLGLMYGFSSDSVNLYIRVLSSNENTTLNMLRAGFTVYINTHGVADVAGAAGIAFPTGNRVRKDGNMLNDRPELQQDKRIALQQVGDYVLFGFPRAKTPETYDYPKPNPEGIQVAAGLNAGGELVYEASVPLASFNPGRRDFTIGLFIDQLPGQGSGNGGGLSIGGGLGFGSFGSGGGIGLSIGSGSLGSIGGKRGKGARVWRKLVISN